MSIRSTREVICREKVYENWQKGYEVVGEIVRCRDCKYHHTSEMYEYCNVIAVKGRRQRTVEYCSLGERKGGDEE